MTTLASPFVGLSYFTPRSARYFTGRERFALTLAASVLESGITVLFGPSGGGKSSLLGAALPDALGATLASYAMAESDDDAKAGDTLAATGAPGGPAIQAPSFRMLQFRRWHPGFEARLLRAAAAKLEAPPGTGLHAAMRGWAETHGAPAILVLDQFEEFFLYHPRPLQTPLVQQLAAIAADVRSNLHILLSLREDSLARLDALRAVIPDILAVTVPLRPLGVTAARDAIRKPVATWASEHATSVTVEDSLIESLIRQVQVRATARPDAAEVEPTVELPLLQLTLDRLWRESSRAKGGFSLAGAMLDRLGGAAGIVRDHLLATIGDLNAGQRALAPLLFRFLVTAGGGKQAWRAADLARELKREAEAEREARGATDPSADGPAAADNTGEAEVAGTLQLLASGRARILRTQPDPRGGAPLYELFHDALADPVQQVVREALVAEAQRRLSRARRRQRITLASAIGVLAVMAGLTGLSLMRTNEAREATSQAEMQKTRAVATLARQASERGDHMTAMLAALEVLPDPAAIQPRERAASSQAARVLLQAWWYNREKHALLGHIGGLWHAAFSPDGRLVVTASEDRTARVWELAGGLAQPRLLQGHDDRVLYAAFSPDGRYLVTASSDGTARVWDLAGDLAQPRVLQGHGGPVVYAAFSAEGRYVLTGSADGMARVWDISGPRSEWVEVRPEGGVQSAMVSTDGRRVLTLSSTMTVQTWPLPELEDLVRRARASLTRGLTAAQRDELGLAIPPDAPADRDAVPLPPR